MGFSDTPLIIIIIMVEPTKSDWLWFEFYIAAKVGWNIQNSFKNANKKKNPLDIVFVNNFCGSGELGRRANVSKLKNHAKYGNCQNIFLTYHFCDNYPLAQKFIFAFIVNKLLFWLFLARTTQ